MAQPLMELSTTSGVRSAAIVGAGPAVLSGLAVGDDIATGRLVDLKVRGADLARVLRVVWPLGRPPTGPARDLLAIASRSN